MMKRCAVLAVLLLLLLLFPAAARAEDEAQTDDLTISEGVHKWLSGVDWNEWERTLSGMPEEVQRLWSSVGTQETTQRLAESGGLDLSVLDAEAAAQTLGDLFLDELKNACGTALLLLGVLLTGGVTGALTESKDARLSEVAGLVCRGVLLLTILGTFLSLAKAAVQCISSLSAFMEAASPALMTLLTAVGGTTSAGVFQPAMALLCTTVTEVVERVILPLTLCGGVIGVIDRLSERMRLTELSKLLADTSKWTVGALTALYLGVTGVRGMTAAAFDGISLRAARYAASSAVPMFGTFVSGTFDTMLGCAALAKNALGVTAILLCAGMLALPALRLLAFELVLRLAAAAAQPLSGSAQASMLKCGADMIAGLLSACVAVGVMFIVTIGLMTGLGNVGYL